MSRRHKSRIERTWTQLERVRGAYSEDALREILELPEQSFGQVFQLDRTSVPQRAPDDFYLHQDNGSQILAVAHLDTVADAFGRTARFVDTEDGPVVFSRALDDRLGAYVILDMLPKLGLTFDVLLTVGEESGCSTAQYFEPQKDYNWIIEFDRGGTDVVLYQYEDGDTAQLVRNAGARVGSGSFSDISYMSHLECKAFNWGVGYQDYHGPRSHAFLDDTFDMVMQFLEFHRQNADEYLPHDGRDDGYYGSVNYLYGAKCWKDEEEPEISAGDDPENWSDYTNEEQEKMIAEWHAELAREEGINLS